MNIETLILTRKRQIRNKQEQLQLSADFKNIYSRVNKYIPHIAHCELNNNVLTKDARNIYYNDVQVFTNVFVSVLTDSTGCYVMKFTNTVYKRT